MGAQPSAAPAGRSRGRKAQNLQQIDVPLGITVEVPSSPAGRGVGSLRSPGSVRAASFAPMSEPTDSPLQDCSLASRQVASSWALPSWQAHASSSPPPLPRFSGDLEAGHTDLEAGTADIEIIHADSEPVRQPSKMSAADFGFEEEDEESTPMSARAEITPSSSRGFSRPSSSACGSRPASAGSRAGMRQMAKMNPPSRDPGLAHVQKCAELSLAKLQQQDFIAGREAWGVSTPSTMSNTSMSRASSSISGSRPPSSAASITSSNYSTCSPGGKDADAKEQLRQLKQRQKASASALLSELKGSASATPARYSTWPTGCALRVSVDDAVNSGLVSFDSSQHDSLLATLVNYNSPKNTFEVKLDDGSTRIVPAQRVTRARARDRANVPSKVASEPSTSGYMPGGLDMPGGLEASGYQAPPRNSQRMQHNMSGQPPLAPEPTMFGQTSFVS